MWAELKTLRELDTKTSNDTMMQSKFQQAKNK